MAWWIGSARSSRDSIMTLRRWLVLLAASALGLAASVIACSGDGQNGDGGADASTESSKDGAGTPALIELTIASPMGSGASRPVALVPAFSPDIHDYYVRCPAATNALTVSMTASPGAESLLLSARLKRWMTCSWSLW